MRGMTLSKWTALAILLLVSALIVLALVPLFE
jgi:hypothetical protein